jgi:hypothetical protein
MTVRMILPHMLVVTTQARRRVAPIARITSGDMLTMIAKGIREARKGGVIRFTFTA